MPLVVPGLMGSNSSSTNSNQQQQQQEDWLVKLVGKTLSDEDGASDNTTFPKRDLPKEHRIIEHGDGSGAASTLDHRADRLNVYLAEDGTVRRVDFK